jgi:hypothetical protein
MSLWQWAFNYLSSFALLTFIALMIGERRPVEGNLRGSAVSSNSSKQQDNLDRLVLNEA